MSLELEEEARRIEAHIARFSSDVVATEVIKMSAEIIRALTRVSELATEFENVAKRSRESLGARTDVDYRGRVECLEYAAKRLRAALEGPPHA